MSITRRSFLGGIAKLAAVGYAAPSIAAQLAASAGTPKVPVDPRYFIGIDPAAPDTDSITLFFAELREEIDRALLIAYEDQEIRYAMMRSIDGMEWRPPPGGSFETLHMEIDPDALYKPSQLGDLTIRPITEHTDARLQPG